MRLNDKKIFLDKSKLYEMLNLRRSGYALTTLAIMYDCDISSIRYQCDKFYVQPIDETYTLERIISQVLPKPEPVTYKVVNNERINLGKSYAEYLIPIEKRH